MIDLNKCEGWQKRDKDGMVMPWYTHAALDEIEKWDLKGKWVYEFGAGQSTLWWRSKGCRVNGVDIQKDWADAAGVEYRINTYSAYISHFIDFILQPVDIVCVDGEFRDGCIRMAIMHMKRGQKLIIDNWDQPSVWIPEDNTRKIVTELQHTIYKQEGHPDWHTLIATK